MTAAENCQHVHDETCGYKAAEEGSVCSFDAENCAALEVQKQLQDAMDYKSSTEEKKARLFLANLGIDYDAITKDSLQI